MSSIHYMDKDPFKITWSSGGSATATYQGQGEEGRWTIFFSPMDRTAAGIYGKAFGTAPISDEERARYNYDPGPVRTFDRDPVLVTWVEMAGQPVEPPRSMVMTLESMIDPWQNDDKGFVATPDVTAAQVQEMLGCPGDTALAMLRAMGHFYELTAVHEGWGTP